MNEGFDPTALPDPGAPDPAHSDPATPSESGAVPPGDPADALEQEKRTMRSRLRRSLAGIDAVLRHEASVEACARVMRDDAFNAAHTVMLYMPLASEVNVSAIAIRCFQSGKVVGVPRVDPDRHEMRPVEVRSFDGGAPGIEMERDALGVRSPRSGHLLTPESIDVVVLPGLAFDTTGRRLGRGGGYYDRFLSRLRPRTRLIAIAFDLQIVDRVPVAPHDVRVDLVVTERRTIETGAIRVRGT